MFTIVIPGLPPFSLIKMLYWMCEKTNMPLTGPQLVHAIRRNFGGLEDKEVDPEKIFFDQLPENIEEAPDLSTVPLEVRWSSLFVFIS